MKALGKSDREISRVHCIVHIFLEEYRWYLPYAGLLKIEHTSAFKGITLYALTWISSKTQFHWKITNRHQMTILALKFNISVTICSTACVDEHGENNQAQTHRLLVWGAHKCPLDSPHSGPVMRKTSCNDVEVSSKTQCSGKSHINTSYDHSVMVQWTTLKVIWLIKIHNFCSISIKKSMYSATQGRTGVTLAPTCVQGLFFNSELKNVSDIWKLKHSYYNAQNYNMVTYI